MIYLPGCISRRQLLDGVRETFQFAGFGIRQNSETRIFYYCDWEKGTAHIQRNLNALGMFGPPKTEAGNRVITLLEPALEALKAQRCSLKPKLSLIIASMALWNIKACDSFSYPGCAKENRKPTTLYRASVRDSTQL